jgi:hypothetical protein
MSETIENYAVAWDAENGMFGIYEWDDLVGIVGDALDHGDTVAECNDRIKQLKGMPR